MPIHPFLVHFALSLALLYGGGALFPKLRDTFPPRGQALIEKGALLFLALAILSGGNALDSLRARPVTIPPAALLHRLLALSGATLFVLLWIAGKGGLRLSPLLRRSIGLAGLLFLLAAAAEGGHLVYDDRLGTEVMPHASAAPPSAP